MNKSESKRPLGNNSFAALRQSGAVYVDKTAFVQQIADSNPPLMLTRPRHFGKSMLVSALEELFLHGTAPYDGHDSYFKGLAIEQWHDRPPFHSPYYVLRLDFAALNAGCATVAQFRQNLIAAIVEFCRTHELSLDEALPDWLHEAQPNLGHVLRKLFKAVPHNSLVLLVDDYDAPVLAHADDEKELEACKPLLLCLFVSIKCHYDKCRCVFFTGTTRYVDLDPLGGGHNFMNDSQEEYLATCCGFTRSELKHYFESQLQHALALRIGCLPQSVRADQIEALLDELESHYGGYSFDGCPEHKVFAPEPVLRFLAHPEVQNWPNPCVEEGLGAPQLLKVALARVNMRRLLEQFNDGEFKVNGLDVWRASVHNQEVDALAFFFALGYLTLSQPYAVGYSAHLTYPNQETKEAFIKLVEQRIFKEPERYTNEFIKQAPEILASLDPEQIRSYFNQLCAQLSDAPCPINDEGVVGALLSLHLQRAGLKSDLRVRRANRRAECCVELPELQLKLTFVCKFEPSAEPEPLDDMLAEGIADIKCCIADLKSQDEFQQVYFALVFCADPEVRNFARIARVDAK